MPAAVGSSLAADVAEVDERGRFAADDEFRVEAGGAFHVPRVPVVPALERRGLDPGVVDVGLRLRVRRRHVTGVSVRAEVGDDDLTGLARRSSSGRREETAGAAAGHHGVSAHLGVELDLAGRVDSYSVHRGLPKTSNATSPAMSLRWAVKPDMLLFSGWLPAGAT